MKEGRCKCRKKDNLKKSTNTIAIDIDYKKLAQAIVNAHEIASKNRIKEEKENHKKWLENHNLSATTQPLKFFQLIWFVLRFPFIRKSKISAGRASYALEKTVVISILRCFQILFLFLGVVSAIALLNNFDFQNWNANNLIFAATLFLAWVFYGTIRMSIIEIDKMRDRQMLLSILSAITSFVAMIVAIVALFV